MLFCIACYFLSLLLLVLLVLTVVDVVIAVDIGSGGAVAGVVTGFRFG